ncbi:NAD-dependent epimerase/dehydratase family protein [Streptomyces sp. NPDC048182]|uniref:NAD-dependent epimerase/dehydratase family protein n=1 Tax=Streptomyces sp. NPDC048182 TaxID=3365507 RepID=UPI0037215876
MQRICVIGGSRYFGESLVRRLRDAGHRVTVLNRGSAAPPPGVGHLVADRDDEAALTAALGSRAFDTVVDQVCYTPVQAATAARAFTGRTRRYVMTSTIEVYDPGSAPPSAALSEAAPGALVSEEAVDPAAWPVRAGLPWHDAGYLEAHYAEGKRQAEAVLARHGAFAFAAVRGAHVLGGGARDFTGRLAHYVERVRAGAEIAVHAAPRPTVFVHHEELARLLSWAAAESDVEGPLNACSDGPLDVRELVAAVAAEVGRAPRFREVAPGEPASPYSFDRSYPMSNARARQLGFALSRTSDWLPGAVAEAVAATRTAAS